MPAAPEVVTRAKQPYVAIRARVSMAEVGGLGAASVWCMPDWAPAA